MLLRCFLHQAAPTARGVPSYQPGSTGLHDRNTERSLVPCELPTSFQPSRNHLITELAPPGTLQHCELGKQSCPQAAVLKPPACAPSRQKAKHETLPPQMDYTSRKHPHIFTGEGMGRCSTSSDLHNGATAKKSAALACLPQPLPPSFDSSQHPTAAFPQHASGIAGQQVSSCCQQGQGMARRGRLPGHAAPAQCAPPPPFHASL